MCSDGYLYNPFVDRCTKEVICPAGGTFNPATDVCEKIVRDECPAGYIFESLSDRCVMAVDCGPASLNPASDRCETPANITCPDQYAWTRLPIASCEAGIECPAETSFDQEQNGCLEGYDTCPAGDYPCADIDGSGINFCSPDECIDFDLTPPEATPGDTTGFQDDGMIDQATGQCSGVFKIFNGKPQECLRPGWETTFFNCCDTDVDNWLFFQETCPNQSLTAAQAIAAGRAHYVGKYCRIDVWLIGCIQSANMYCTFNSKMARIIHEQGRRQLRKFGAGGGWGSPQAPNCEGFTPEEFQMLDFSKIDLSEIYGDITPLPNQQLQTDVEGAINAFQNKAQ
jgi:hypothetical protein